MRGRQPRPWMVQSATADAAILSDHAGGIIHIALTSLHPDELDSPPTPTPTTPQPTHTADHRTDPT